MRVVVVAGVIVAMVMAVIMRASVLVPLGMRLAVPVMVPVSMVVRVPMIMAVLERVQLIVKGVIDYFQGQLVERCQCADWHAQFSGGCFNDRCGNAIAKQRKRLIEQCRCDRVGVGRGAVSVRGMVV